MNKWTELSIVACEWDLGLYILGLIFLEANHINVTWDWATPRNIVYNLWKIYFLA